MDTSNGRMNSERMALYLMAVHASRVFMDGLDGRAEEAEAVLKAWTVTLAPMLNRRDFYQSINLFFTELRNSNGADGTSSSTNGSVMEYPLLRILPRLILEKSSNTCTAMITSSNTSSTAPASNTTAFTATSFLANLYQTAKATLNDTAKNTSSSAAAQKNKQSAMNRPVLTVGRMVLKLKQSSSVSQKPKTKASTAVAAAASAHPRASRKQIMAQQSDAMKEEKTSAPSVATGEKRVTRSSAIKQKPMVLSMESRVTRSKASSSKPNTNAESTDAKKQAMIDESSAINNTKVKSSVAKAIGNKTHGAKISGTSDDSIVQQQQQPLDTPSVQSILLPASDDCLVPLRSSLGAGISIPNVYAMGAIAVDGAGANSSFNLGNLTMPSQENRASISQIIMEQEPARGEDVGKKEQQDNGEKGEQSSLEEGEVQEQGQAQAQARKQHEVQDVHEVQELQEQAQEVHDDDQLEEGEVRSAQFDEPMDQKQQNAKVELIADTPADPVLAVPVAVHPRHSAQTNKHHHTAAEQQQESLESKSLLEIIPNTNEQSNAHQATNANTAAQEQSNAAAPNQAINAHQEQSNAAAHQATSANAKEMTQENAVVSPSKKKKLYKTADRIIAQEAIEEQFKNHGRSQENSPLSSAKRMASSRQLTSAKPLRRLKKNSSISKQSYSASHNHDSDDDDEQKQQQLKIRMDNSSFVQKARRMVGQQDKIESERTLRQSSLSQNMQQNQGRTSGRQRGPKPDVLDESARLQAIRNAEISARRSEAMRRIKAKTASKEDDSNDGQQQSEQQEQQSINAKRRREEQDDEEEEGEAEFIPAIGNDGNASTVDAKKPFTLEMLSNNLKQNAEPRKQLCTEASKGIPSTAEPETLQMIAELEQANKSVITESKRQQVQKQAMIQECIIISDDDDDKMDLMQQQQEQQQPNDELAKGIDAEARTEANASIEAQARTEAEARIEAEQFPVPAPKVPVASESIATQQDQQEQEQEADVQLNVNEGKGEQERLAAPASVSRSRSPSPKNAQKPVPQQQQQQQSSPLSAAFSSAVEPKERAMPSRTDDQHQDNSSDDDHEERKKHKKEKKHKKDKKHKKEKEHKKHSYRDGRAERHERSRAVENVSSSSSHAVHASSSSRAHAAQPSQRSSFSHRHGNTRRSRSRSAERTGRHGQQQQQQNHRQQEQQNHRQQQQQQQAPRPNIVVINPVRPVAPQDARNNQQGQAANARPGLFESLMSMITGSSNQKKPSHKK